MGFKRPRTAIALGLLFVFIAAVYLAVSHDFGGATTLFGLGIAMAVMAFALVVGTPDDA